MIEILENARDELKRVDHLIFVSLKYTRTVDVLKNVLHRMIESYDFMIDGLLRFAEEKHMIFEAPTAPHVKATTLIETFKDPIINEHMKKYILFKKALKVEDYESINEYRRHVAFITEIDGEELTVNIDFLTDHFKTMKEFLKHVQEKVL